MEGVEGPFAGPLHAFAERRPRVVAIGSKLALRDSRADVGESLELLLLEHLPDGREDAGLVDGIDGACRLLGMRVGFVGRTDVGLAAMDR